MKKKPKVRQKSRKELLEIIKQETTQVKERLRLHADLQRAADAALKRIKALEGALKLRNYQVAQIAAILQLQLETSTEVK